MQQEQMAMPHLERIDLISIVLILIRQHLKRFERGQHASLWLFANMEKKVQ